MGGYEILTENPLYIVVRSLFYAWCVRATLFSQYSMTFWNELEEGEPKKLVKVLKMKVVEAISFARKKLFERQHDIICREYTEESYHSNEGLERDYRKEMTENVPRYFTAIKEDAEEIWRLYSNIYEAYTYLRRVAPELISRNKDILEGMFTIIDYHNSIQSRLSQWEDTIVYYNDMHNQPVVIIKRDHK